MQIDTPRCGAVEGQCLYISKYTYANSKDKKAKKRFNHFHGFYKISKYYIQ